MNGIPATVQILTNLSCNLDCTYCYEHKEQKHNDIDTIKTFMYIKFKTIENKHIIIDLIGGESFLFPELCDEIFSYALQLSHKFNKHIFLSTTTNGTTLKNPKVRALIEKYKTNDFSLGVSVDGTKENHDKYRIYKDGSGSYEDAIEYLPWLFKTLGKENVSVKATFTVETYLNSYYEGMVNLIKLGFTQIAGNIVFEDIVTKDLSYDIVKPLKQTIDYIVNNNLESTVKLLQFGNSLEDIKSYMPVLSSSQDSWCGTCVHMACLGIDGKLYGCNRFCTMDKPGMELGTFSDNAINITNTKLLNEVTTFKRIWPEECQTCLLRASCPTCVAAIYEVEDKEKYVNEKRQCGWTHAISIAKMYFASKLKEKELKLSIP
jgi:radical SAM protein with 4Fe4S-binding SPASM domain